jgi:F-type H+-transporting ATPase subunit delta
MIDAVVGRRYASAIYDLAADANSVKETHDELNTVMELFEKDNDFKVFITHPLVHKQEKKEFLGKVLEGLSETGKNILGYLVDKDRMSDIRSIVTEYLKIYYEKNQIIEAEAVFAAKPTEVQVKALKERLEAKTNKEVILNTKVDVSILGGIIVKLGDDIIDASIRKDLERFRTNY